MGGESAPVLIDGQWRAAAAVGRFRAFDPTTGEAFGESFPISGPEDVEDALAAASSAAPALSAAEPDAIARFLEAYAAGIEANAEALIAIAHRETALHAPTRLATVELPRTTSQLRKAAEAVRARSWTMPVIDTTAGLRSRLGPLSKPVLVFGPNNFPLAFHAIAGSDFASAIAARNPVIAKGHPNHPGTGLALARLAHEALEAAGLPAASVQLLHHFESDVGLALCADARLGAIGFTGSRAAGLALKAAADRSGTPFFGELSAINPVLMLPGALAGKAQERAAEYAGSCLLGGGQFCTNPGLLIVPTGADGDAFVAEAAALFSAATESGSVVAGADDTVRQALFEYGDALGIAFQIVDDLLDYGGSTTTIGKNVGDDFRERKLTLPVIKAIAAADAEERDFWERCIGQGKQAEGLLLVEQHHVVGRNGVFAYLDGVGSVFLLIAFLHRLARQLARFAA